MCYNTLQAVLVVSLLACVQAQNNCASQGITATVRINVASFDEQVTGTPGGIVLLSCIAELTPNSGPLTYRWYHMDEELNETSNALRISSFQGGRDGGRYECSAVSSACTSARSPVFNVNAVPVIMLTSPNGPVAEGDPLILNCTATGWPVPAIQWQRLISTRTVVIQAGGVYTVAQASSSDSGQYDCVATNSVSQVPIVESLMVQVIGASTDDRNMMMMNTDERNPVSVCYFSNATCGGDDFGIAVDSNECCTNKGGESYFNGNCTSCSNPQGFYIAIGITAGVSLLLALLSLLCCIITLSVNYCCYSIPKDHDVYEDWPDGEENTEMNAANQHQVSAGGEGVMIEEDENKMMDASPSEIGQIV